MRAHCRLMWEHEMCLENRSMQMRDKVWQDMDNSRLDSNNNIEFAIADILPWMWSHFILQTWKLPLFDWWRSLLQRVFWFQRSHSRENSGKAVLLVRFEVGVSLLLAPAGADKRGLMTPFPLVENARLQPEIRKRVPAGAPAAARSYWKRW